MENFHFQNVSFYQKTTRTLQIMEFNNYIDFMLVNVKLNLQEIIRRIKSVNISHCFHFRLQVNS